MYYFTNEEHEKPVGPFGSIGLLSEHEDINPGRGNAVYFKMADREPLYVGVLFQNEFYFRDYIDKRYSPGAADRRLKDMNSL